MRWSNFFLDSLNARDIAVIGPNLRLVELSRDDMLSEPGERLAWTFLPVTCVISVVTVLRDGKTVESRTVGRESGYGLLQALGSRYPFERVTAQIGGAAYRIGLDRLTEAASHSPTLQRSIVQHAQAAMLQAAQGTACNAFHSAERRMCKWLLLTQDRLEADVIPLTQENIATMLGVQRTTVTAVASQLQARGIVSYARGRIRILDREALMGLSCECYESLGAEAARVSQGEVVEA